MFERPEGGSAAVLVHLEFKDAAIHEDVGEFRELVISAGAEPLALIGGSRRAPDARYFVGRGKAEEIGEQVQETGAELVIFDHALNPGQERNLEQLLQCRVLDRTGLILDIFAQRAQSFEGKLQVELAQLRHLSTRLVRGWTHLERQKGGIGLRGPGEKQLETDRRLLSARIKQINRRLDGVEKRRELSRRARRKADVPVISLVGYTNAGKSSLFNRLSGADVLAEDRLFATLDPTLRRVTAEGAGPFVLADTVGFIRHLPHDLVAAFRATLEETRNASLLFHVIDAAAPERELRIAQVNEVLAEIGAGEVPQIEVYNKLDLMEGQSPRLERDSEGAIQRAWVSAQTGEGVSLLHDLLVERYARRMVRCEVHLSTAEGRLRARLFELGKILHEAIDDQGSWTLKVEIEPSLLEKLCRDEGLDRAAIAA